jgi:hypothetical protein
MLYIFSRHENLKGKQIGEEQKVEIKNNMQI